MKTRQIKMVERDAKADSLNNLIKQNATGLAEALNTREILSAVSDLPELGNLFERDADAIKTELKQLDDALQENLRSARALWTRIEDSGEWSDAEMFRAIFKREPR